MATSNLLFLAKHCPNPLPSHYLINIIVHPQIVQHIRMMVQKSIQTRVVVGARCIPTVFFVTLKRCRVHLVFYYSTTITTLASVFFAPPSGLLLPFY